MTPITDESVLAQLNARPVTDPDLIAKLEGGTTGGSLMDRLKPIASAPLHPLAIAASQAVPVAETLMQMGTGFAGALPGAAAGLYEAARGREYAPAFKFVQGEYTYEPRSEGGKKLSEAVGGLFEKYSAGVDWLAERTPGGPLAQTAVKTLGEAIPLIAPFTPRLIRRKPVADSATVEALEKIPEARPTAEVVGGRQAALDPRPATPKPVTDQAVLAELAKPEPFELRTQTEVELKARDESASLARGAEQEPAAALDAKRLAEAQAKDFGLTGSDRPADVLGSRAGQGELKPVTDAPTLSALEEATPITEINVGERPYQPPRLDTQNDSITTALAKLGGMRTDFAQDVAAVGARPTRDVRGFSFMLHKKGRTADEMAELLHESGYLEARDLNEMFAKLDGELRAGKPTHFSIRQDVDSFMRGEMERRYGPEGQLYSGLPLDKASETIGYANRKLHDALGVPEKGVTVERPFTQDRPGVLAQIQSPGELVKKFPELGPYKQAADRAQVEMDTLRDAFGRRLQYVDTQLGGRILEKAPDLGKQYRENKTLLNEILLAGDFMGKRFTREELRSQFGAGQGVINAYEGLRSAYDHALTLANKTREPRGKDPVAKREGYVPHFFHEYFILGNKEILGSARTLREAVSMGNDAARAGVEVKIVPKQLRFEGEEIQAAVVGDATYFKLREALEDTFSMTRDQANALMEDIARMRGRSRLVGNFFERKGAPNWEKNLDWAHRHYFNLISRYVALDKFKANTIRNFEHRFGQFDREHKGIAKYVKDYVNDINGVPSRVEEVLNNALQSTPGFKQFTETFLGERPSLRIAQATTNAVAIAKLGLYNVSAALVNGSQLLMSHAVLGPRWFAEGARRAGRVTWEIAARRIGMEGATTPDIGILRQLDVPIMQGLESGAGYSKSTQAGGLFRASTAFFRGVEFELRATTGLGAYYKALSDGRTKAEALERARDINRRVNFDYSIADTPNFIRRAGPAGQVLFQFKKFPVKAMEFMVNLKGAENARFWIPFTLIAGYYGFPGVEAMNNTVKAMFGIDLQLETKNYLMRWAGDDPQKKAVAKTIFYGAFANDQLGGVDISRRVGGGDFIPSKTSDLFGPFFSSAIRATQMAAGEHWVEALRQIAAAPGNIALAIRNDGEITNPWDRDRLTTQLDTRGRILKAIGFGTTQESTERDVARVIRYNEAQQRDAEKRAIDEFIRAYQKANDAGMDKAVARFAELGMGEGTGARIKEELYKKGIPVSERAFMNLGRKGKARELEVMEFAR